MVRVKQDGPCICMYVSSIIWNYILYIGFTYMYVSRIIFWMDIPKFRMKVLIMYLCFPIFKLLFSSSPKLYLFHFKNLFWCFLNVNFYHNNFAKLHRSHMTLNPFEILLKHEKLCLLLSLKILAHLTS